MLEDTYRSVGELHQSFDINSRRMLENMERCKHIAEAVERQSGQIERMATKLSDIYAAAIARRNEGMNKF